MAANQAVCRRGVQQRSRVVIKAANLQIRVAWPWGQASWLMTALVAASCASGHGLCSLQRMLPLVGHLLSMLARLPAQTSHLRRLAACTRRHMAPVRAACSPAAAHLMTRARHAKQAVRMTSVRSCRSVWCAGRPQPMWCCSLVGTCAPARHVLPCSQACTRRARCAAARCWPASPFRHRAARSTGH